jgi:16S rRNA U1498 N3-methylase RsmE
MSPSPKLGDEGAGISIGSDILKAVTAAVVSISSINIEYNSW